MKQRIFLFLGLIALLFSVSGCNYSNKKLLQNRLENMQKASKSPVSIEEIKSAIGKYDEESAEVLKKNAQVGIWYKILGTRYIDKKMYGEALECFEKALEYYPENPNLYYYVGRCAAAMSRTVFENDMYRDPKKRENYLKMCEDAYIQALQLEPRYSTVLYSLGVLYTYGAIPGEIGLNDPEKAIPYLIRFLDIETRDTSGMFVLARAYAVTEQYEKSVEMYDKIISITKSAQIKADAQANKKQVLDASYGL